MKCSSLYLLITLTGMNRPDSADHGLLVSTDAGRQMLTVRRTLEECPRQVQRLISTRVGVQAHGLFQPYPLTVEASGVHYSVAHEERSL